MVDSRSRLICARGYIGWGDFQLRVDGLGFDGIGRYYDQDFVHADVRSGGQEPGVYLWDDQGE